MRTIAFLTQKGGAGKTTLAASLAEVAASTGEKVIALDLDPQQSLVHWAKRREAANARNKIIVEPLERERLPRLRAILDGLANAGFTLAIFDTTGADAAAVRPVSEVADLSLLPARPTRLDVEATAATFRAVFLAKRKAAFVLNQCPSSYRSTRASEAASSSTALACWLSRCCPRVWIFRTRLPPASVSLNTPAAAGRPKKSRRCGTGAAGSSRLAKAKQLRIGVDRLPPKP